MPMKPEDRAKFLQWLSRECQLSDLKEIKSFVEAEVGRRQSAVLVQLMPGDRIRYVVERDKQDEPTRWDVATILRIHRRSIIGQRLNGKETSIRAEDYIETLPEETYQQVLMSHLHGSDAREAADTLTTLRKNAPAEVVNGMLLAELHQHEQRVQTPTLQFHPEMQNDPVPPLDPSSVQLADDQF